MTTIFKNYDALTTLTKNLEKLGVSNEIVTKAIIQSIGEMDSMMSKFLISAEKETTKTSKDDPKADDLWLHGQKIIKKSHSDMVDEEEKEVESKDEKEDVVVLGKCEMCGKKDGVYPHYTSNGCVAECPFTNYGRGQYFWLVNDLYLRNDWLIFARPHIGPFTVGKKASGTKSFTFRVISLEISYEFETCRGYEQIIPHRSIFVLDDSELKLISTKAEETYKYLHQLNVL